MLAFNKQKNYINHMQQPHATTEEIIMRKTVALFRSTRWGWDIIVSADQSGKFHAGDDCYQVSHTMEIEFPMLTSDSVVKSQIDALDNAEKSLRLKFADELLTINNKRAELRALTYTPSEGN